MKALITGASSGLGKDMARILADYGIDLILVARRLEKLKEVKEELEKRVQVRCITMDLSDEQNCRLLYAHMKQEEDVDILINNAGFGLAGDFDETDLNR